MVLFRVNCTIPTLSKSEEVRGKYCIVLQGEGNEFQFSTKDTLIARIARRVLAYWDHS